LFRLRERINGPVSRMSGNRNRLELLARLGYAARGVVSLIVGGLALLAALGRGGRTTDSKGALQTLMQQPLGEVLLGIVAVGLFGFALWRIFQSLLDADGLGTAPKALARRAGQAVSAAVYFGLGVFATRLLLASGQTGGGEQDARDWTAWLLAQPFGRWLAGAAGLALIGAAIGMAHRAWTGSFRHHLACGDAARWVVPLGRLGFAARGVVFLAAGAFLVIAAYRSDPSEARGLGGVLRALQEQPFGQALFAMVALGLAAFGAFGLVQARFRRIDAPRPGEIAAAAKRGIA
jgi:hypothetical protein